MVRLGRLRRVARGGPPPAGWGVLRRRAAATLREREALVAEVERLRSALSLLERRTELDPGTCRDSEDRFQRVVQASPMGIHLYAVDDQGRLVFEGANPAADALLGVDN